MSLFHDPENTLYVIVVVSNPCQYSSRYRLYREFRERMKHYSNVVLYTVELVFGDANFQVTTWMDPRDIQLRTHSVLWHKENLINIGVSRLPKDWKYVAWLDADIAFSNPNWVEDTINELGTNDVVQVFSHAIDLGPDFQPIGTAEGFCRSHEKLQQGIYKISDDPYAEPYHRPGKCWHSGYGWATTREFWNRMGGLLDIGIVGNGDYHMACAFIGEAHNSFRVETPRSYRAAVLKWARRFRMRPPLLGWVPGTILHYWHGAKQDRGYVNRWLILQKHEYNPRNDLHRRTDGLIELHLHKPYFAKDLLDYFHSRKEDEEIVKQWHKPK